LRRRDTPATSFENGDVIIGESIQSIKKSSIPITRSLMTHSESISRHGLSNDFRFHSSQSEPHRRPLTTSAILVTSNPYFSPLLPFTSNSPPDLNYLNTKRFSSIYSLEGYQIKFDDENESRTSVYSIDILDENKC
jgi:hypothetical protein